jgi:hypothetical protein
MRALHELQREQLIPSPIDEVFAFFSNAENLEMLTPSFLRFRILSPLPIEMKEGTRIDYSLTLFGVTMRWRTRITTWEPGVRFVDEQESGPYAVWQHTHEFEPRGTSTLMRDVVRYREPLGPLGALAHVILVRRTVERIFDYRREALDSAMNQRAG